LSTDDRWSQRHVRHVTGVDELADPGGLFRSGAEAAAADGMAGDGAEEP
jgi:hypothetical protein